MPRFFLILWIFFLLFQAGCSVQGEYKVADNSLAQNSQSQADPYAWDFGKVKEGKIVEHTFVLKNESPKTLNIKDVSTSCGCTVSKVEKKVLLPGESTEIEVKFNSKGYSGTIQQFVYVNTDNLDNPLIRFIIRAEVVK